MVQMSLAQLQAAAKAHNTANCITKVSTKSKATLAKNLGVTLTKAPRKPAAKRPVYGPATRPAYGPAPPPRPAGYIAHKGKRQNRAATSGPTAHTKAQRAKAMREMSGPIGQRLSHPGGQKTRKDKGVKKKKSILDRLGPPVRGPKGYRV